MYVLATVAQRHVWLNWYARVTLYKSSWLEIFKRLQISLHHNSLKLAMVGVFVPQNKLHNSMLPWVDCLYFYRHTTKFLLFYKLTTSSIKLDLNSKQPLMYRFSCLQGSKHIGPCCDQQYSSWWFIKHFPQCCFHSKILNSSNSSSSEDSGYCVKVEERWP